MPNRHSITFFGLTTCVHCRHAKEFLEDNNQPFDMIYVDLLEGEERREIVDRLREYNPRLSFPTIVIDGGKDVIVGFHPEQLSRDLDL